jgi:hypothetical protein
VHVITARDVLNRKPHSNHLCPEADPVSGNFMFSSTYLEYRKLDEVNNPPSDSDWYIYRLTTNLFSCILAEADSVLFYSLPASLQYIDFANISSTTAGPHMT